MIDAVIDSSEKILWDGKPDKFLYILGAIQAYLSLIIFAIVSYFAIFFLIGEKDAQIFVYFAFLLTLLIISGYIYRIFNWKHVRYVVTDKRIYIESGVIGRDIDLIEFLDVKEPIMSVGYLENSRGKGTIQMNPYISRSGRRPVTRYAYSLVHVADPQLVFQIIKQQSMTIRADASFSNANRPEENPYVSEQPSHGENRISDQ